VVLVVDAGNTNLEIGLVSDKKNDFTNILSFRYYTRTNITADEFALFILSFLKLNNIDSDRIKRLVYSSVVPPLNGIICEAFIKYFNKPVIEINHLTKLPINNRYKNPEEVGADRLVNAVAVHKLYNRNSIIVDMGTATTVCSLTEGGDYLGGVIIPGIKTATDALTSKAARLPAINISHKEQLIQAGTAGAIESGVYFSTLYGLKGIIEQMKRELGFDNPLVIGTGGYIRLFSNSGLVDVADYELSIKGLKIISDLF